MDFDQIDIDIDVVSFFEKENHASLKIINAVLRDITGVVDFFEKEDDYVRLRYALKVPRKIVSEKRTEYGDFQTNPQLSEAICNRLVHKRINPRILLEPTCGKGSFILAAIKFFDSLQQVFGIEIQEKYLWELKFNLLAYFLNNPSANKPQIRLYHCDVFNFDFKQITSRIDGQLLIIGNPPWVTNATLSTLNSTNLPAKSNFTRAKGIDAITGKGNFDIGEYITLKMLDMFSPGNGHLAFLVKNSVIRNIVFEQKRNQYPIGDIQKHAIDAQKEFGAAVDASLLVCQLNSEPAFTAREYDFYHSHPA